MVEASRITVADLQRRMEAGEDFVLIDARNPQAWAESEVKLPEAIRVAIDKLDETIPDFPREKPIVAYCT